MNYGRFFRLNQALSIVMDGVAIYDYIDLPAYFGPSVDNPMSPKYPISVTVTSDAVCFRLHYCAFKIEEKDSAYKERKGNVKEEHHKEEIKKFLEYAYDKDEIDNKLQFDEGKVGKIDAGIGMAHMEEMILELPWNDSVSNRLSDTIKKIYSTTFPQVVDENTSMGGRFLEQLIKKRYPGKENADSKELDIEKQLYRNLQKVSDETVSYSTLWLMDLVRGNRIYLYSKQKVIDYESKKEKEINVITGFLRKLLLDFMFDLKHSDVFQNSANYQKMYSGLMSDFYFSALIHKCEYYYYRALTNLAIDKGGENNKERVKRLYADELIKAEELWVKDIMSAEAENNFEYKYTGKGKIKRYWLEINNFQQWPSWFAEPEEEMRRVYFTMEDQYGKKHICNSDVLVKYLELNAKDKDDAIKKMVKTRDTNKEIISRWFLMRYNFHAVLHLHFFKLFNTLIVTLLFIPMLLSLFFKWKLTDVYQGVGSVLLLLACTYLAWLTFKIKPYKIARVRALKKLLSKKTPPLVKTRRKMVLPKICFVAFIAVVILLCIFSEEILSIWSIDEEKIEKDWNQWKKDYIVYIYCLVGLVFVSVFAYLMSCKHLVSRLHLLLPRLIASIALSWITLSMGFDLYVSYFDAPLQWSYIIFISAIVLVFIMYEINRISPNSQTIRKFLRSLELLTVSYIISLIVGLVIINFLGEKYLERGGYISEYYTQYVDNAAYKKIHRYKGNEVIPKVSNHGNVVIDSTCVGYSKMILDKLKEDDNPENFSKRRVESLTSIYFTDIKDGDTIKKHPVADKVPFFVIDIFILRDFLIMFAFIAMFMGIFIQLIIFGDNKQMTEL